MKNTRNSLCILAALSLLAAFPAHALVTQGDANASAIDLMAGDISITVLEVSVNGNDTDSAEAGPFSGVGLINAEASSNVDGSSGSKTASASSSLAEGYLDFMADAGFGISFDLLSSSSTVTGDEGSFLASASSTILNLAGTGLLSGLHEIAITGAPNQTLFSLFGIEVIANRQVSVCTASDCFISTNALYIDVTDYASVMLANSTAHLSAAPIPEPETAALMMLGLAGLVGSKRLRSKVMHPA